VGVLTSAEFVVDQDAACEGVEDGVDPAARREKGTCDYEEGIWKCFPSHGNHSSHCDWEGQGQIGDGIQDHELSSPGQFRSVVGYDASNAATEVDEDMAINCNGAKLDNEYPEVMQP